MTHREAVPRVPHREPSVPVAALRGLLHQLDRWPERPTTFSDACDALGDLIACYTGGAPASPDLTVCGWCGQSFSSGGAYAAGRLGDYCSKHCQEAGWADHQEQARHQALKEAPRSDPWAAAVRRGRPSRREAGR
jgi:hypothetical protein